MVRIVLIALLASCYKPSIADCVDTCGESKLCPEGLSCVGGYCTSGTACVADAPDLIDALVTDALRDAGIDASVADAMLDAQIVDAMVDAIPADAMVDAMVDATPIDAMIDAMVDAPPVDAMVDAAPDAMVDAPAPDAMVDAPMCPSPPTSNANCTVIMPPPQPPSCFTVCVAPVANMISSQFSVAGWHAAVIKSDPEEQAAIAALNASGQAEVWIGLIQGMSPTLPGDNWHWIMEASALPYTAWATNQPDDNDNVENHEQDCATITINGWYDQSCSGTHPFLIEPDPI